MGMSARALSLSPHACTSPTDCFSQLSAAQRLRPSVLRQSKAFSVELFLNLKHTRIFFVKKPVPNATSEPVEGCSATSSSKVGFPQIRPRIGDATSILFLFSGSKIQ